MAGPGLDGSPVPAALGGEPGKDVRYGIAAPASGTRDG